MVMQLIETKPKYRKYNPDIVRHLLATDDNGETAAWCYIAMTTDGDVSTKLCDKILDHELERVSKRTANKMVDGEFIDWSNGKIKFKRITRVPKGKYK